MSKTRATTVAKLGANAKADPGAKGGARQPVVPPNAEDTPDEEPECDRRGKLTLEPEMYKKSREQGSHVQAL